MYNQECALYIFQQHNLTNKLYYERFSAYVDVGEVIGIKIQHRFLMEGTAQETFQKNYDLSSDEQL